MQKKYYNKQKLQTPKIELNNDIILFSGYDQKYMTVQNLLNYASKIKTLLTIFIVSSMFGKLINIL